MELEGDGVTPRHFAPPESISAQNFHVTPETVVALAVAFGESADLLMSRLAHSKHAMQITPWMQDPVSEWVREQFDDYFVHSEHAFVQIVHSGYVQHVAIREALIASAQVYGLTEELINAGFTDAG